MRRRHHAQSGFTLVELLIAMAISSLMLLVMSAGVLRLYNIYEAGNQIRTTQQAARTITEEISREARKSLAMGAAAGAMCVGESLQHGGDSSSLPTYNTTIYYLQTKAPPSGGSAGSYALYRTTGTMVGTACSNPGSGGTQLSPDNTSIITFVPQVIDPSDSRLTSRLLTLDMSIASTNALDLVDTQSSPASCMPQTGSQYCSITSLKTSVVSQQESSQ